jgi:hypothetical protein
MKYSLLLLICFCLLFNSYSQTDSSKKATAVTGTKIYSGVPLKRGFFRNYEAYINNSPTPPYDFTVDSIFLKCGQDSFYEYLPVLKDSSSWSAFHGYGFCDGNAVYLSHTSYNFKMHYWKTDCIGPYPFYTIVSKDLTAMPGLPGVLELASILVTSTEIACNPLVTQLWLTFKSRGKCHETIASQTRVKDLLKREPDLVTQFMQESQPIVEKQDTAERVIVKNNHPGYNPGRATEAAAAQKIINDNQVLLDKIMKKYLLLYNERSIAKETKAQ